MPGYAQGYLDFLQGNQQRQMQAVQLKAMQDAAAQRQAQMQARQRVGQVLYDMQGQDIPPPPGTPQGGPQPQPPGTSSQPIAPPPGAGGPGPGPQAPGGGNPMAPGGASVMAPPGGAPNGALGQIPPYQAMPKPGQGGPAPAAPAANDGEIPPPPAPAAGGGAQAPGAGTTGQRHYDLQGMIAQLKKSGVPPDQAFDMLEQLEPMMNNQNKRELDFLRTQNTAMSNAQRLYVQEMNAWTSRQRAEEQARENRARDSARDQQNDLRERTLQAKLHKAVGGTDNLKRTEFVKDEMGNVVGMVGVTKSGKIVRVDTEGNVVGADKLKTDPKARQFGQRDQNSVRQELATLEAIASPTKEDKARKEDLKKWLRDQGLPEHPGKGGGTPGKPKGDAGGLPAEARAQLKEGQVTTFKNGQKWTLEGGQPKQVQ